MSTEAWRIVAIIALVAWCLWWIIRDDLRTRREQADARLVALINDALDAADDCDLCPPHAASDTPIHDDLAAARLRRELDQWGAGA